MQRLELAARGGSLSRMVEVLSTFYGNINPPTTLLVAEKKQELPVHGLRMYMDCLTLEPSIEDGEISTSISSQIAMDAPSDNGARIRLRIRHRSEGGG